MGIEQDVSVRMLASIIRSVSGATIAAAYVETVPDMFKRGNPFWDRETQTSAVLKRQAVSIALGGTYQGAVNRSRFRAWTSGPAPEPFVPARRSWGTRATSLGRSRRRGQRASIVMHDGVAYLDVQRLRVLSVSYVDRYGNEIPREAVEPWLKQRERQPVDWRDYTLSNVRQLRMNGMTYNVRLDAVAEQILRAA